MAFSLGGSNGLGSGRRRLGAGNGAIAEMNVVPLVDVVLVLLIIFMLTAHVMDFGLEINVPKTKEVRDTKEDLPVVLITRDAKISLNEKGININQIPSEVARRFPGTKKVYVKADAQARVDSLVQVISVLGKASLTPLIVTQPEESSGKRR
jgi:biopolymer transport protein ExbD